MTELLLTLAVFAATAAALALGRRPCRGRAEQGDARGCGGCGGCAGTEGR